MKEKEALRIVTCVARALAHAHENGVIHRDVKPANIMLSKGGTVKLGDFGLARGQGPSELTLEHAAIGTPQYLAPEQAAGAANASPRSDLFSLGATLYHLVTGQPPFTGENLAEIFGKVIQGRFEPPEAVVDDLSVDTLYLIHRLMRPNPRDRYASARDLIADLEKLQAGQRIAPADFKGDYQTFLDRRRHKRMLIGGAAVALIAASAWFTVSTIHKSNARDEALAECRALNDVGRGELEALSTLGELTNKRDALREALASKSCEKDLVSGLKLRVESLDRDIGKLDAAESILQRTEPADANYRGLARELDSIMPALDGARKRRDFIRRELTRISDEEARGRRREVYFAAYDDAERAIEALRALAHELEERFLPLDEEWADDVGPHARELTSLDSTYLAAHKRYGKRFDKSIDAADFDLAASHLESLQQAWDNARVRAKNQGLPDRFLQLFEDDDVLRRNTLVREESGVWNAIKADIAQLEDDGRPDLALTRVDKFLPAAQRYRETAEQEQKRLRGLVATLLERQQQAIAELELTFRSALGARQYAAAVARVTRAASETNWIGGVAIEIADLKRRAQAIGELNDKFLPGLKRMKQVQIKRITGMAKPKFAHGSAFDRAPGPDPDRYILRLGGKNYAFTLKELDRKTLEAIFGIKTGGQFAPRAYFHFAEAQREREVDPYEALRLLKSAAADLRVEGGDRWLASVEEQTTQLDKRTRAAETSAGQLIDAARKARERNDYEHALDCCNRLFNEFGWTNKVRDSSESIAKLRDVAKGYVGVGLLRRHSAIPPKNYIQPDSKKNRDLVVIRYTGAEWHPLKKDIPPGIEDPAKWLLDNERKFFKRQFLGRPRGLRDFDEFFRRATHQLLDWGGAVDVRRPAKGVQPEDWKPLDPPGYMLKVPKARAPWEAWWHGRQKDFDDTVIHLTNHFRHDRNWSIEFTVEWDKVQWNVKWLEGSKVKDKTEAMAIPGYFAVSAGKIQAAIGYFPYANGGVAGTRIFQAESMTADDGQSDELSDFHWHMAIANDRKKMKRSDRAWLDRLRFARDSAYRIRLERLGSEIHFRFMPLGRFDKEKGFGPVKPRAGREKHDGSKRMHIWYKASRSLDLTRAVDGPNDTPAFRFTGRVRFVLRDVEVTGYLKEESGS